MSARRIGQSFLEHHQCGYSVQTELRVGTTSVPVQLPSDREARKRLWTAILHLVHSHHWLSTLVSAEGAPGGNEFSLERLRAEAAELARQATRSSVTIYGIDPRGLSGPPRIEPNVNDAAWQKYWTTTRNSLQVISEQTGGLVIQDDLDGNLKRIVSTMR